MASEHRSDEIVPLLQGAKPEANYSANREQLVTTERPVRRQATSSNGVQNAAPGDAAIHVQQRDSSPQEPAHSAVDGIQRPDTGPQEQGHPPRANKKHHYLLYTCLVCVVLLAVDGIVLLLIPIQYYIYPPGTEGCTEYSVLSPDVMECGVGDSCSYSGVYTSVPDGYSLPQPILTKLIRKEDLILYTRQRSTFHSNGTLIKNVLFQSLNPVYTFKNSVFSGVCSVNNQNDDTETARLEIYSNYSDAIKANGRGTAFSETLSIPGNSQRFFQKWGPDKPFTVPESGYYFFLLSVSADDNVYYNFEQNTTQVYVNESDYNSNIQLITSGNRSHYSYGTCHRNGGFRQTTYITLCKAPPSDIFNDELRILSCFDHLQWSDKQIHIFMGVGIAAFLSGMLLILMSITSYIVKVIKEKKYKSPTMVSSM